MAKLFFLFLISSFGNVYGSQPEIIPLSPCCAHLLDLDDTRERILETLVKGKVYVGGIGDVAEGLRRGGATPTDITNFEALMAEGLTYERAHPYLKQVALGFRESEARQDLLFCFRSEGCEFSFDHFNTAALHTSTQKHPDYRIVRLASAQDMSDEDFAGEILEGDLYSHPVPLIRSASAPTVSLIFINPKSDPSLEDPMGQFANVIPELFHEGVHYIDRIKFGRLVAAAIRFARANVAPPNHLFTNLSRAVIGPTLLPWVIRNRLAESLRRSTDPAYQMLRERGLLSHWAVANELDSTWTESRAYQVTAHIIPRIFSGASPRGVADLAERMGFMSVQISPGRMVLDRLNVFQPDLFDLDAVPKDDQLTFFGISDPLTELMDAVIAAGEALP